MGSIGELPSRLAEVGGEESEVQVMRDNLRAVIADQLGGVRL